MTIALFEPSYEDLKQTPIGEWVTVIHRSGLTYQNICGKDCMISLSPRPNYCNRGRFLANLEVLNCAALHIDYHDGWDPGRYYFDEGRAKAEIEAWLACRNQLEVNNG